MRRPRARRPAAAAEVRLDVDAAAGRAAANATPNHTVGGSSSHDITREGDDAGQAAERC